MSTSLSSPHDSERDSLSPASPSIGQYGTFSAPSDAGLPVGSTPSGSQPVAENGNSDPSINNGATDVAVDHGDDSGEGNREEDTEAATGSHRPVALRPLFRYLPTILTAACIMALFTVAAWLLYPSQPPPAAPPAPSPPSPRPSPIPTVRVLIVGDSITQGAEGDYSWRYRLWEWSRDSPDANVTFVGPYNGTFPPSDAPPPPYPQPITPGLETRTWGGYALDVDPAFLNENGKEHFAHWGRQVAQFRYLIRDAVEEYQPDYVLVALGFNDLAWISDSYGTIESMRDFIGNARAAKGDVKFAVANVPRRTPAAGHDDLPAKTDEYNDLLEGFIERLTSERSPIHLVRLRESYSCGLRGCPASHDGLHPNALGEFQIAKAFSQVLYEKYGLGNANFTIPATIPLRPCWAPKNVRVFRTLLEDTTQPIKVTWDRLYGAFGYFVQARQKGWGWGADLFTDINEYRIFWPGNGQQWEVRVKSYCGDQQDHSPWSDVVSIRT